MSTFWALWTSCYICWVRHVLTIAIFSTPPFSSRSCLEDLRRHGGVPRTLTEVLGVHYTQSVVPMKNGVWRLVTVSRYSDVSVNIVMYTLFNNIVSDTIHSVVVCVDFLGTHMASLVLFLKLGVTSSHRDLQFWFWLFFI